MLLKVLCKKLLIKGAILFFKNELLWVSISGLLKCLTFSRFVCSDIWIQILTEGRMTGFKHYRWGYISHFPCTWLNHVLLQLFSVKLWFASAFLGLISVCLDYSWFFLATLGYSRFNPALISVCHGFFQFVSNSVKPRNFSVKSH